MYELVQGTHIIANLYQLKLQWKPLLSIVAREEKVKSDPCSLPNGTSVSLEAILPPILHHLDASHQNDEAKI